MGYELAVLSGITAGSRYPLVSRVYTIGRSPSNDICIPDPCLSRNHAAIVQTDWGIQLQSKTEGRSVKRVREGAPAKEFLSPSAAGEGFDLEHGDVLYLGPNVKLQFLCDVEADTFASTVPANEPLFAGRYELGPTVGEGGMGKIIHAFDRKLHREVALKLGRRNSLEQNQLLLEQFQKEATISSRLTHPNILPVYDLGEHEGTAYYTMRLVQGATLAELIDPKKDDPRFATLDPKSMRGIRSLLAIAIKSCRAVDHAHNKGVVHLDIKPGNILLSQLSEVFVIDWGLAILTRAPENLHRYHSLYVTDGSAPKEKGLTDTTVLPPDIQELLDSRPSSSTEQGENADDMRRREAGQIAILGTASYASPEQFRGTTDVLSEASDIYGIASTFYHCLASRPPIVATSLAALSRKVQTMRPPPLPSRVIRHKELDVVLQVALEKKPENRYESVYALRKALESVKASL